MPRYNGFTCPKCGSHNFGTHTWRTKFMGDKFTDLTLVGSCHEDQYSGIDNIDSYLDPTDDPRKWVRLRWSALTNKTTGLPQTDPSYVLKVFKRLEKHGWNVDDSKFRERHYP